MEYISASQFAQKYGISERTARNYCAKGKIEGAFLTGKTWNIPAEAALPKRDNKIEAAHQALKLLKEGNARFVSGNLTPKDHYAEDRLKLSEGQHPFAVVLCCSDSRVSPEILFDQQLGDLFVIRNAGNVVDEDVLGSIEYAVEHLESPLVVILGHSSCGAVTAACQGAELPGHIVDIAMRIKPSISTDCCVNDNARRHAERMAQLVRENPIVEHLKVTVVAAFYHIDSGVVDWM